MVSGISLTFNNKGVTVALPYKVQNKKEAPLIVEELRSKLVLRCEDCKKLRTVYRNAALTSKSEHPCRACSNVRNGVNKRGKGSPLKGTFKEPKKVGNTYTNYHGYVEVWLGRQASVAYGRKDGYVAVHRKVMQDAIGRPLEDSEIIHHIDNDKMNNDISNLCLCADVREHRNLHAQLEDVAFALVKKGLIQFDTKTRAYVLSPSLREK